MNDFYRQNKTTKNIKNSYMETIKGYNYEALVSELQSVNNRLFSDKTEQHKQDSSKFDRAKGNSYEVDKWKKVQLLNLIQKKYKKQGGRK